MRKFIFLITAIAAAYLSMPVAAAAQDFSKDTLWSKNFWPENVNAACFTPDGKYVLAAVGKTFCKYDINTGELISRFKDTCSEEIYRVGWSENVFKIATFDSKQKAVVIWDYYLEKKINTITIQNDTTKSASCIDISPDNQYLLCGNYNTDKGNLTLYNLNNYDEVRRLNIKGYMKCISFSPDGRYLISGSEQYDESYKKLYSYINLFETQNWTLIKQLGYIEGEVVSLNYSPDGRYLACGRGSQPLTVWDMNSLSIIKEYQPYYTLDNYEFCTFSNESKYVLLGLNAPDLMTDIYTFLTDSIKYQYTTLPNKCIVLSKDDKYILLSGGNRIYVMYPKWITTGIENTSQKSINIISIILTKDSIHFEINIKNSGLTNISIYDINGNKVQTFPFKYLEPGHYNFIRPSSLPTGVYFAVMQCGDNTISQQFEVVR